VEPTAVALQPHLTLFEYGTCLDQDQAAALFERRQSLQPYVTKRLLTRSLEGDKPCLRASHYIGLLPFPGAAQAHLLLIAPKGCRSDWKLGLLRFLELLTLSEGETPPKEEDIPGCQGQLGPEQFLLFLAGYYARLLQQLCSRDFRSYYRPEEGELRGRIRGRLHHASYARLAIRGKPHLLPCRWEEFTVDNWDNRILWAAACRLKQVAGAFDSQAAASVWKPFKGLLTWFSAVAEVPITTADFHKSRLGRTSPYYRRALAWARLLLQGSDLPARSGQAPPLVLDTHKAFEKFAEAIARSALPDGCHAEFQIESDFLTGQQTQKHRPDILLSDAKGVIAVGDAKYKEVLEGAQDADLETSSGVLTRIQPADWYQLYVYMRMKNALCGFFIVPFWKADGNQTEWLEQFSFLVPPSDPGVRVAVLSVNLLKPLAGVKQKAAERLREWLSSAPREPLLPQPIPHSG
jgi:hypothetical protein